MKRSGLKTLKSHYVFLVILCLAAALLGTAFSDSLNSIKNMMFHNRTIKQELYLEGGTDDATTGSVSSLTATDVLLRCLEDGVEAGDGLSKELKDEMVKDAKDPALGRTRGVLSSVVNYFSSGSIWVNLVSAMRNLVHSDTMANVLVIAGVILLYCLFLIFVQGFYEALMQRMFLECRTYSYENYGRLLHFIHIRRWVRASLTMLVRWILQVLWSLTIVGGIIKYYSYYMVPYIVAENADIKPMEAITLSRRMMDGHKWDCFVKSLSFIGWNLLGIATLGLSDILFTNAYETAAFAEYYARIRKWAIEQKIEGSEKLNDPWLFERAPQNLLDEAYAKEKAQAKRDVIRVPERGPFARFLANWAGIVSMRTPAEVEYEKEQRRHIILLNSEKVLEGELYPARLSPVPEQRKNKRVEGIYYDRNYTVVSLCLLFLTFSFMGWLWEGALSTIDSGQFVNRGALFGPWLPIYGGGCVLVLIFLKKLRSKPILHFFATIALCGILEYLTGLSLELMHNGKKWWDYSGYFLNINGRVCAEGLLVFGVLGSVIVYVIAPLLDSLIRRVPMRIIVPITVALMTVFLVDDIHSIRHPNEGAGVSTDPEVAMTEHNASA